METPKYKKKGKAKTNLEKAAHPRFERKGPRPGQSRNLDAGQEEMEISVYGLSS